MARSGDPMIGSQAASMLFGVLAAIALAINAGGLRDWSASSPLANWFIEHAEALALVGTLATLWVAWRWRSTRVVLGALAGAWLAGLQLQHYAALRLPLHTDARALVSARIVSIPLRQGAETTMIAEITDAGGGAEQDGPRRVAVTRRALLRWYGAPPLHASETWQLLVNLNAPHAGANPGRSNPELAQLRDRMHVSARVVSSRLNKPLLPASPSINGLRERIASALRGRITERDAAALIVALAVGETQYVSREQWRVFNATGITHLIAISGLHVTLFSLLMSAFARRLWNCAPLLQRWRRESFAALLGVSAAAAYALLSGFSVPAQRTLIMLATWHALRGAARGASAAPALSVALLLVLLLDPLAPLAAGFWLSFVAVAVLLHATEASSGSSLHWRALWHTQWRVAVGLMPVTLAVFGSVSVAGLAVNLLAIPLFTLLLVPMVLAATLALALYPPAANYLLDALVALHALCWPVLVAVADTDFALWRMQPPWWWFALAMPAAVLALLPWRWPLRLSAALALLPALYPLSTALRNGEFRMTVLDVGRGLAVLVQTARHALLFDNGETWGSDGAQSRGTVLPALRALQVRELDRVLAPKLDADRSAGLVLLAAEYPVRQWQAGSAGLPPEFNACQRGANWTWDGVQFQALSEQSCALRVVAADGVAALIPGDLDRLGQQQLLDDGLPASAVVIVPKHASAAGYLRAFRDANAAQYAIVSHSISGAGASSVQGTLAAWRDAGAEVLLTAETGAIEVSAGGGALTIATRR